MKKEIKSLSVSECFDSIQGEGPTTGKPAIFLRLSGCNILCKSENWICDSIDVWKKGTKTDFENVLTYTQTNWLQRNVSLVITGGEPMLHQAAIESYIKWLFKERDLSPYIEIETNGTIMPSDYLLQRVNQWNCSPKLKNSGEVLEKRYQPAVLEVLNVQPQSTFKFVIDNESDIFELLMRFQNHIDRDRIWLMPAGASKEELSKTQDLTAKLCIEYGLRYCERVHIGIWDKATGV